MSVLQDLTVYIGRFSPLHNGHCKTLLRAMRTSKVVLILIGSCDQARTTRNPFTFAERAKMIDSWFFSLPSSERENINAQYIIKPLVDSPYNDLRWINAVQTAVQETADAFVQTIGLNPTVYLTGAKRDSETSWYLECFPGYEKDFIDESESEVFSLAATHVRDLLFTSDGSGGLRYSELKPSVPQTTLSFLAQFISTQDVFLQLQREYQHISDYRKSWAGAPFAPTFVTVDAVVVQSGHVLLIQRKEEPGKDLWALPGGFLEVDERLIQGVIRELQEETSIKLSETVLRRAIKSKEIFDHPNRSLRGRTITTAFLFCLEDTMELPHIRGSSDAKKARWVPISEVNATRDRFFEDHFAIIETMLARYNVLN